MFKNFKSQIKDVSQKGQVVIAANAFGNIDSQGDISMQGSFSKTLSENFDRLKWFLNHDTTQLLGVPIQGVETPQYLQITGQLNLNKDLGRNIYEDYKLYAEYGKTLEHSIGVDPIKFTIENSIRKVTEWKLWEFSTLTAWGANPDTPMLAIKSENDLLDQLEWLNLSLIKGNFTDEKFKEIESQIINIKSLIEEPGKPTQSTEPIDWKGLSNQFLKTLKH